MQMFVEIHRETALPFVLNTVGYAEEQPPVSRPRGYDVHQFLWVKEGSGRFWVGDETFVLHAGEGLFTRADLPHGYTGAPFFTQWVTFRMSHEALDAMGVPSYLRFSVPAYLEQEADGLYAFAKGNSTVLSRSAAGYSLVTALFSTLLEENETLSARAVRFLERHYGEPLTLDEIADSVEVDRFALCRVFKRERGMTVTEALKDIRIAKAKRFLKYSADSVEAVGRQCGFESASYFCKTFRQSVGCSPNEYRKRHR